MTGDEGIRAYVAQRLRAQAESARVLAAHYTAQAEECHHDAAFFDTAADLLAPPAAPPSESTRGDAS